MEQGGWLYKCGHFHPSTFLQIIAMKEECDDCRYAKELLEQAKHLRRRRESAPPMWSAICKFTLKTVKEMTKKRVGRPYES